MFAIILWNAFLCTVLEDDPFPCCTSHFQVRRSFHVENECHKTCKSSLSCMLQSFISARYASKVLEIKASSLFISTQIFMVLTVLQHTREAVWEFGCVCWQKTGYQKRFHIQIDRSGLRLICLARHSCCNWIWIAKISTNIIVESHRPWLCQW